MVLHGDKRSTTCGKGRLTDFEIQTNEQGSIALSTDCKCEALLGNDKDHFAWDDGFRPDGATRLNPTGAFELMMRFWKQTHELPFIGDLIKW